MTKNKVNALIGAIVKMRQIASDEQALEIKSIYPAWKVGVEYKNGDRVLYNEVLYKILTEHTSQEDWTPDVAASLWTVIDEIHAGTIEDPIPYNGNMALINGMYYSQDEVIYLCNRDTVNPVYNSLFELIGLYVEKVN